MNCYWSHIVFIACCTAHLRWIVSKFSIKRAFFHISAFSSVCLKLCQQNLLPCFFCPWVSPLTRWTFHLTSLLNVKQHALVKIDEKINVCLTTTLKFELVSPAWLPVNTTDSVTRVALNRNLLLLITLYARGNGFKCGKCLSYFSDSTWLLNSAIVDQLTFVITFVKCWFVGGQGFHGHQPLHRQ